LFIFWFGNKIINHWYKGTLFFYIFVFFPTFFCNFAANLDKYRYFDDGIFLKPNMDFPKT